MSDKTKKSKGKDSTATGETTANKDGKPELYKGEAEFMGGGEQKGKFSQAMEKLTRNTDYMINVQQFIEVKNEQVHIKSRDCLSNIRSLVFHLYLFFSILFFQHFIVASKTFFLQSLPLNAFFFFSCVLC